MRIGTDILDLKEFPDYLEGNEKRFFQDNFTENEIKHTLLKNSPNMEFARLFSIKESLVKADNKLLNTNFNYIEVLSENGSISFGNCEISSSIGGDYCISIVISI